MLETMVGIQDTAHCFPRCTGIECVFQYFRNFGIVYLKHFSIFKYLQVYIDLVFQAFQYFSIAYCEFALVSGGSHLESQDEDKQHSSG